MYDNDFQMKKLKDDNRSLVTCCRKLCMAIVFAFLISHGSDLIQSVQNFYYNIPKCR